MEEAEVLSNYTSTINWIKFEEENETEIASNMSTMSLPCFNFDSPIKSKKSKSVLVMKNNE